jgi:uncharacterized repeat protein (TIGR01451 family)
MPGEAVYCKACGGLGLSCGLFGALVRRTFLLLVVVSCCGGLLSGCGGGNSSSGSTQSGSGSGGSGGSTPNAVPTVTAVSPASVQAGSASQTLTVTGTGFVSGSTVQLDTTGLQATYVSATTLTAVAPAAAIADGEAASLTVTNPAPGGGNSAASTFNITSPTPLVTGLNPASVPQGVAATVTITGTGFEANSQAQWNGSARTTTFTSSTSLQIAITAADVANYGSGQVTVNNPGPGGSATTPVDLAVIAAAPVISGISPSSVPVNANGGSGAPQQVVITGSGFAGNATVLAGGQTASITSQSATAITIALPSTDFFNSGSISLVVNNPGPPGASSNSVNLAVTAATVSFSISPNSAPAGSPDTTIQVNGQGFFADSVVQWNGTLLKTSYVSNNSLTAVIPSALLSGFANAAIGIATPENNGQAPPTQPFTTYLALAMNDIVYNVKDGLIYASVPGAGGPNLGNSVVGIDPNTGVAVKTIFVGSEPNRIALSTDGTKLFVGLDGAGAVREVNLTTDTAGVQFSLGGGPGLYNPPYTAESLAAVPGEPDSVAVYGSNGVVTIFDAGVARSQSSSNLETYFVSNLGGLAFGSSASTLYVTSEAIGSYVYQLTVGASGITASTQLSSAGGGTTLQYDDGRLYLPVGVALNAATGAQLGQFSYVPAYGYGTTPTAAVGPIVSDSTLGRAFILPTLDSGGNEILSFDETSFDPTGSIALAGVSTNYAYPYSTGPADLIRWGESGIAFHTGRQLFVLQSPIVKDTTATPADVAVSAQAPTTATTGKAITYTFLVSNGGSGGATGVTLTASLPDSLIPGTVKTSQGSCSGTGQIYCDLGTLADGASATVAVTVTPSTSGTVEASALVAAQSYDPAESNNQATASTVVSGALYSPQPSILGLSPELAQAGSSTFTLTVNGTDFTDASTVMWNGTALPTSIISSGQLTATVDTSLVTSLGWADVSVASAAPGGGESAQLPFSIYQILNVPANAMAYDPFTRKLYAVLPSTATSYTGNTIVAIDPATGSVGTPIAVGSEPNLLSETSDGNYMYIGLSGAKSLGRFNMLTQKLDLTVPLVSNASYQQGTPTPAISIATVPGSDTSLAVEDDSFDGIGILDITGSIGVFRTKSGFGYSGDNPVFVDPTHFYAYDADTTGAEFYRYSIDSNGVNLIDGTSLNGLGGFGGVFAVDGGLVYGSGGGIVNPSTTPPSQVAELQPGPGPYGTGLIGGGAVPYAAESKNFLIAVNDAGTALDYLQRFDTNHFVLEDQLPLPGGAISSIAGTRWGQDGLAYLVPSPNPSSQVQIFLLRGPFVLPAEGVANSAPTLSGTATTPAKGSGNQYLTVTGSGFLPGATVLWAGSARTTSYVDAQHLSVAIAAADVQSAATITLTAQNPGSAASNALNLKVQ